MNPLARLLPALLALWVAAAGAQPVRVDHAEAELVAATDAIVPGQALAVGLRIRHDPRWHTYWQVPGDSGLPTTIRWQLPEGFAAGPIEWPLPKRLPVGPLMNFGYDGELLLPVQLQVPAALAVGQTVALKARADWLICEDVCIPGGADLQLALPVREQAAPSRHAAQFARTRAQIPQPIALDAAAATIESDRIRVSFRPASPVQRLEFFPLEEARIEPAAAQTLRAEAGGVALYLTATQPVAEGFTRLKGVLVADGGPAAADRGGWAGIVDLPLRAGAVASVLPAAAATVGGEASAPMTLWLALAGALIGGLILNLMPCVFPVLSLKLLSLMQHQRAENEAHLPQVSLRAHGGVFAAGVVLCFVLLAGALIALRAAGEQLGWGFQLQSPAVIAALTLLFFLIGLNLLGTFEFSFGGALVSSSAAQRLQGDRLSGSFATGVLAVVVAAPCTAPFMGAALGYAMTQPAPVALAVFAMLGAGMAAPYVALTWWPALLQRLPRPGVWMLRFKQAMAFPMFATCVWLLWVLAQQVGVDAVALVLGGLVLAALAAWAVGLTQSGGRRWRWVALAAAPLALYALFGPTLPGGATLPRDTALAADADGWQRWSRAAQDAQLAGGRPVFVDFTAAWCVTCQANKRLVLGADAVRAAFAQRGVTLMRADWTNRDDEITRELARFNRNGVPLYVLYDGNGGAQVLPELLSERIVREALARL
jgi:thiol:disulfide interchange protein/DsbC/DsbD-like thiol-disulfide interchange protein